MRLECMDPKYGSSRLRKGLSKRGLVFYAALVLTGLFLIAAASSKLYSEQHEDFEARSEYDQLRDLFSTATARQVSGNEPGNAEQRADEQAELENQNLYIEDTGAPGSDRPDAMVFLTGINPDFVGWISNGDDIDYPVVRGSDNDHYLSTTFSGTRNPAGAIFMDYRIAQGFDAPLCILYGHNMRDGSMFASLNRYADPEYSEEHSEVIITTPEGKTLVYKVFETRLADMQDTSYEIDNPENASTNQAFDGEPAGAGRYLLLSTCTPGADRAERMLVFAELVN